MSKMLQLTANSWLIRASVGSSGLLFKTDDSYVFMNPETRINFETFEDVKKKFGKLTLEERIEETETTNIKGYPVRHLGITVVSEDPPLYTLGAKTVFAAGFFGLKFPHGWVRVLCPKQKTLETYEHVGPFKNKLEMLNEVSRVSTRDNLKGN